MRKHLYLSAAVLVLALPAAATAGTPGFVDFSISTIDVEGVTNVAGCRPQISATIPGNHCQTLYDGH